MMKRTSFVSVSSRRPCRSLFNFSFFGIASWGIDLDYCDVEWFALETSRDHSVTFEPAPNYCISDSLVDSEVYSISSKEFLTTIVDIMVT